MPDLIYGEEVDRRLNWSLGRAERLARKQKLPHYVLPDGSIRFSWKDVEQLIKPVAIANVAHFQEFGFEKLWSPV